MKSLRAMAFAALVVLNVTSIAYAREETSGPHLHTHSHAYGHPLAEASGEAAEVGRWSGRADWNLSTHPRPKKARGSRPPLARLCYRGPLRAGGLERRARDELVAAGARPRRAYQTGVGSLTASELRIVRLAASGLNNKEIAERLFVTRRTVETHLTHAYEKLGIEGRAALANALAEQDSAASYSPAGAPFGASDKSRGVLHDARSVVAVVRCRWKAVPTWKAVAVMARRKVAPIALGLAIVMGSFAGTAQADGLCNGQEDGYLHLRISPAQGMYELGETVKVNAEVVRRLPMGDVPVEGAEVVVSLSRRGFVAFGRAITDVDGQAILRIRSDRLGVGLLDAGGSAEVTYTDINHCVDPTHRDTDAREDFVRIVK